MFDKGKLDAFFEDTNSPKRKKVSEVARHTKLVRMSKLLLPAIAAMIIGLLLIIPHLKDIAQDIAFDITKPKLGELEKLHVENTTFYITDAENQISNFYTSGIDETLPGSKLIKLDKPEGTVRTKNNNWIKLKSKIGFYNQTANSLNLEEKTKVSFSQGMDVETESLTYDFDKSYGHTNSPINGSGTLGEIKSEGLEFFEKTGVIIFKGKTFIKINEENIKGIK